MNNHYSIVQEVYNSFKATVKTDTFVFDICPMPLTFNYLPANFFHIFWLRLIGAWAFGILHPALATFYSLPPPFCRWASRNPSSKPPPANYQTRKWRSSRLNWTFQDKISKKRVTITSAVAGLKRRTRSFYSLQNLKIWTGIRLGKKCRRGIPKCATAGIGGCATRLKRDGHWKRKRLSWIK